MGFDIGTLAEKEASDGFLFEGEKIEYSYRPHLVTPELRARWSREVQAEKTEEDTPVDYDCTMLSKVLTKWNLTAGGEALPLTYEALLKLPDTLVVRWRQELFESVGKLARIKSAKT